MTRRREALGAAAALAAVLLAASCAPLVGARPLSAARPGETTFHRIRAGGRERSFLLHLPPGFAPHARRPAPLLLAFHGYQASANVLEESSGLDAVADRHGWAVVYPNGTGPLRFTGLAWNAITCCGAAPGELTSARSGNRFTIVALAVLLAVIVIIALLVVVVLF